MSYSRYNDGFKWCSGCSKFVKSGKRNCPICDTQLRNGPKSNRLKPDKPRID